MLNYIPLNCSADRKSYSDGMHSALHDIFKYTKEVNVHTLFDFIAPTSTLGYFDCVLFIDIPYAKGNYYRNGNQVYLNSLAIGIRKQEELEVIDVDEDGLYTKDGSWDYKTQIESDRASLRDFVYKNLSTVKHFDITIIYAVKAPNCTKTFLNDFIAVNTPLYLWKAISIALDLTKSNGNNLRADNIVYKDKPSVGWSPFISEFLNKSEAHTRHGVLTKKKVDALTSQKTGVLMQQVYDSVGKMLCIIGGKAGTGKTLALMKVMYNEIKKDADAPKHNCRLLTFNNMLVADIKQMMKNVGKFTPTKASISSLHKFFYDIYIKSPVRALHMDTNRIDKIFDLCLVRAMKVNSIIAQYNEDNPSFNINTIENAIAKYREKITSAETNEVKDYVKFLRNRKDLKIEELIQYAQEYTNYKKKIFLENYNRQAFFAGYNDILKELYLIFHNMDEFIGTYGFCTEYSLEELRNKEEFRQKHQEHFNRFLSNAERKFEEEDLTPEELVAECTKERTELYADLNSVYNGLSYEEKKDLLKVGLKKIKRKVNWSKYILVDEAQDCSIYEKALLLELNGSDNTIIATGGKDQLIRRPEENDWSQLFGHRIMSKSITLRSNSKRQKGNIVEFLNAFSVEFTLGTELKVSEEILGKGRVIIDCRSIGYQIPNDQVIALHKSGEDYGCSNFENMMFLFPRKGYTECFYSDISEAALDENSTVHVYSTASYNRKLKINLPNELKMIDGTVHDKRNFLKEVGQDNTRCVLYDSCRGLEAWNVMCIDLDSFYYEKFNSTEADEYATANGGGLFDSQKEMYRRQFAALWCYMALTRAMDTLYVKLSDIHSEFSIKFLKAAQKLHHVEIFSGNFAEDLSV